MRIAFVNQDRGIRPERAKGAAVHLRALRDAFTRAGADVPCFDQPDDDLLRGALGARLRSGEIDLVYERYALGKDLASRLCEQYGVPHVLEVNAPLLEEAALYRGGVTSEGDRETERALFRRATRIVCVSRALANWAAGLRGSHVGVVVEPNAVGPQFLEDVEPVRGFTTPGRTVFGFHGRLRPWHAFERTVDVLRGLLDGGADVELAIVGEGEFEPHLAALPSDRVVHVPWVDPNEIAPYVATFDVVLLPYRADAPDWFSPLKMAEAMALGAVPIATDVGDLPREIVHGVSGLVVPARSDAELLAAACDVVSDRELRARLAQGARARGRRRTWDDVAAPILALAAERRQPA